MSTWNYSGKKYAMKHLSLVVAVFLIAGCAQAYGPRAPIETPMAKQYKAPDGESAIYIYRVDQFDGFKVLIKVILDGDQCSVGLGDFAKKIVASGKHKIYADNCAVRVTPARKTLEVQPNTLYFLRLKWQDRKSFNEQSFISVTLVDPDEAKQELLKLSLIEWMKLEQL